MFSHYKKQMSAAGEELSIGMDTDESVGCTIACATDSSLSVINNINDEDDQNAGCAIAHAAELLRSDAKNISDKDDDSFVETCNPVGLKSDKGERVYYWLAMLKKKYTFINHTVRNIQ